MGYNVCLQRLSGLTLHVFGARDESYPPSHAIARTPDIVYEGYPGAQLRPAGNTQARLMARIFKHHGARATLWHPRDN